MKGNGKNSTKHSLVYHVLSIRIQVYGCNYINPRMAYHILLLPDINKGRSHFAPHIAIDYLLTSKFRDLKKKY